MTIKKTSNRSTVAAIKKDIEYVQGQCFKHKKALKDAQEKRLAAVKKQADASLDADTYHSETAKKKIDELELVVRDCEGAEKRAQRNVESSRNRITDLEASLSQAKMRDIKAEVKKFGDQLDGECPGLQKLLKNFTDRVETMLKSCSTVDRTISELGSNYHLKGEVEKAIFGWLAVHMYFLAPQKFERPHRVMDEHRFIYEGDLKDVLGNQFKSILLNRKLTKLDEPFIAHDGLSEVEVVPVSEKLKGEAESMRREKVPA